MLFNCRSGLDDWNREERSLLFGRVPRPQQRFSHRTMACDLHPQPEDKHGEEPHGIDLRQCWNGNSRVCPRSVPTLIARLEQRPGVGLVMSRRSSWLPSPLGAPPLPDEETLAVIFVQKRSIAWRQWAECLTPTRQARGQKQRARVMTRSVRGTRSWSGAGEGPTRALSIQHLALRQLSTRPLR